MEKVRLFAERHAMLSCSGIVIAVSGGPDSIALLDILRRLVSEEDDPRHSGSETQPQRCSLHIAHLDHMLRPAESARDAEFVRGLAESLRIPVTVGAVDVREAARARGRGIEEVAREVRYEFLMTVALQVGFERVAAGHTMTDQAETLLMRLIRGAGLRGLAAMRPVAPVPARDPGGAAARSASSCAPVLIRPLLCLTREEVEAYCRERNLEFRVDATNLTGDFTRNRIRNEALSSLLAINPRAVQAIGRAAESLANDDAALEGAAQEALRQAGVDSRPRMQAYSAKSLAGLPAGIRRRAIIEAIRLARPKGRGEVTSRHVSAVESLLTPNSSGKSVKLPGALEVWREFDELTFKSAAPGRTSPASPMTVLNTECPLVEAGGLTIELERRIPASELRRVFEEALRRKSRLRRDWMIVALDDERLPPELLIRVRVEGELAHVLGQPKTKKLKKLMIDHRIPTSHRAGWPIVAGPDGGYIWSPGLPPSLNFAANDESRRLAILRATLI